MKKRILILLFIFSIISTYSRDTTNVKNILIGIKLALPNSIIGLTGEFNGFNNKKISIIANISFIPHIKISKSLEFTSQNYSIGSNYHFFKNNNAFIGLGLGYSKFQYIDKNTVEFYDNKNKTVNANLIYTAQFIFLKPSIGYYFRIKRIYIKPEIEYYLTNYYYSEENWKYHLENGVIKDGNELFPVKFENVTLCLTVGYTINIK